MMYRYDVDDDGGTQFTAEGTMIIRYLLLCYLLLENKYYILVSLHLKVVELAADGISS